jgi:hypothetical protein
VFRIPGPHPSPRTATQAEQTKPHQPENRFAHWCGRWGRWDSNPHCNDPKSFASCRWATAPGTTVSAQTPSSFLRRATWPVAFTL